MKISVKRSDCIIQKFKGRGPGGQNRNKVETGVRLTHKLTGIVIEMCVERDYTANLNRAFAALEKRIAQRVEACRAAAKRERRASKADAAFAGQDRTYYLHGHRRVIDHRTGVEGNPVTVLNGGIDLFVRASMLANLGTA